MKNIFRFIIATLGSLILINAAYLWVVANFTLGLLLTTVLGLGLLIYGLIPDLIHRMLDNKAGRIVKILLLLAALFFLFTSTLISVSGHNDTVTYKEDAIIVLGAGVHGEEVSRILAYRLDTALTYHKLNPVAYIVVSGGQGDGESITEAEAMTRYLMARGVPANRIIREEQATSTYENFVFSKALLDEKLAEPYTVGYITNRFHIFRAGRIATSAGVRAARLHADNDLITLLPNYLRECCAVAKQWMFGK